MEKFVLDVSMEPIRTESVDLVEYEILEKFRIWLLSEKIKQNALHVRVFKNRVVVTASLDTSAEFLNENLGQVFEAIRQSDIDTFNEYQAFYRPILNIVAFFGDKKLDIEIGDKKSSDQNLINFMDYINIDSAEDYFEKMKAYLYTDKKEGYEKMSTALKKRAMANGKKLMHEDERVEALSVIDSKLSIAEVEFDATYLELPEPIIESVLHKHNVIFAMYYLDGAISNSYLIVYREGTDPGPVKNSISAMINEELKNISRLFKKDTEETLDAYLPKLSWISDIESLGSMSDKTKRLESIIGSLVDELSLADEMEENIKLASKFMKADLATQTVKCYENLRGIVGGEIFEANRDNSSAANAIKEQYLPDFTGREPETIGGAVLAIADRMHDLAGLEILGELNVKSSWAFKEAYEILKLMISIKPELSLRDLIESSLYAFAENSVGAFDFDKVFKSLFEIFKGQFKYTLYKNNINNIFYEDILITEDKPINKLFMDLKDLSSIEDEDQLKFLKDLIAYKKMIGGASDPVEGDFTESESDFSDLIKYAGDKSNDALEFFNHLYEYKDRFYKLKDSYKEAEISKSSLVLADNLEGRWI